MTPLNSPVVVQPVNSRVLTARCPSCCTEVRLGVVLDGTGSPVLHRCGNHVMEALVRGPGVAPWGWIWRQIAAI